MQSSTDMLSVCAELPELVKLGSVIESGCTHDWILRIEHAGDTLASNGAWQEWGKPAFAVTTAASVLENVAECRVKHPTHAIRLHAEKLNPTMRMLYYVYG